LRSTEPLPPACSRLGAAIAVGGTHKSARARRNPNCRRPRSRGRPAANQRRRVELPAPSPWRRPATADHRQCGVNVSALDGNIANFCSAGVRPASGASPSCLHHRRRRANVTNRVAFLGSSGSASPSHLNGPSSAWTTIEAMFLAGKARVHSSVAGGAHATTALTQLGVLFRLGEAIVRAPIHGSNTGDLIGGGRPERAWGRSPQMACCGIRPGVGRTPRTLEARPHRGRTLRHAARSAPGLTTSVWPAEIIGALHLDGYLQLGATSPMQLQALTTSINTARRDHDSPRRQLDLRLPLVYVAHAAQAFTVRRLPRGRERALHGR